MVCIYCGNKTEVVNSRLLHRSAKVWRRNRCKSCKQVFTTIETYDLPKCLSVKKRRDKIEPFCREKIFIAIHKAVEHVNDPINTANSLTDTVISNLIVKNKASPGLITSQEIALTAFSVLKRYDAAAAIRYLSFGRDLKQLKDVKKALK